MLSHFSSLVSEVGWGGGLETTNSLERERKVLG